MSNDAAIKINGLFPGKGQRLSDLVLLNSQMSREILEKALEGYVSEGKIEKYKSGGVYYYLLSI